MWIGKKSFEALLLSHTAHAADMIGQLDYVKHELRDEKQLRRLLEEENRTLRERLIEAEAAARGLKALADSSMLLQNKLQRERDEFLAKILDPTFKPTIVTPQIVRDPVVMPPGVEFEDIGDDNARREGYDVPLRQEELTGMLGQVYDPAADAVGAPTDLGFQPPDEPPGFSS